MLVPTVLKEVANKNLPKQGNGFSLFSLECYQAKAFPFPVAACYEDRKV